MSEDLPLEEELRLMRLDLDAESAICQIFQDDARTFKSQYYEDILEEMIRHAEATELLKESIREKEVLEEKVRQHESAASPRYSVLLLDGDVVQFSANINVGGALIAHSLLKSVKASLKVADSVIVRICIYGSTGWLSDLYTSEGIFDTPDDFETWLKAFNTANPWVEFVDVGSGLYASKERTVAALTLYLQDKRCQGIIFGGEIDDRVVAVVNEHKDSERRIQMIAKSHIIVDVEPAPDESRYICFDGLFRPKPVTQSREGARPVKTMEFDDLGRRVDPRVSVTQAMIDKVAAQTYCNNQYLRGKCSYPRCKHNHKAKLRQAEMDALVYLGRSIKCRNGPGCTDTDCYAGHKCPRASCDGFCGFETALHLPGTLEEGQVVELFPSKLLGLPPGKPRAPAKMSGEADKLIVSKDDAHRIKREGVSKHMIRKSRAFTGSSSTRHEDRGLNNRDVSVMHEQMTSSKRHAPNMDGRASNSKRRRQDS